MSALSAILLTAFGARDDAGKKALTAFTAAVREAFPEHVPRWAFTARQGTLFADTEAAPSVAEGLSRFAAEGVCRIIVQPLHLTDGHEQQRVRQDISRWREGFPNIAVDLAAPLLTDEASIGALLDAIRGATPAPAHPGEAFLWIGHGSPPCPRPKGGLCAADAYRQLAERGRREHAPVRIGYLSGHPSREDCIADLTASGITHVSLLPLFALAGQHTTHDLGGSHPESWLSGITRAGIACRVILRGMAEEPLFAALWVRRLRAAVEGRQSVLTL